MISPHTTGHAYTPDGDLVRIDVMAGRWVASRFTSTLVVAQQVIGSHECAHEQITRWLASPNPC